VRETRTCASCKTTRLSAYSKAPLCSSCERDVPETKICPTRVKIRPPACRKRRGS
jgi:hypothetical protein